MRYKSFFLPDYKIGVRLIKPEQTGLAKRKEENQNRARLCDGKTESGRKRR